MLTKPFVAIIPHQLGRPAARRRIEDGLARIRAEVGAFATIAEERWNGDRLEFRLRLFGRALAGHIEVLDEAVRVEVELPWIVAALAGPIGTRVRDVGGRLLTRP